MPYARRLRRQEAGALALEQMGRSLAEGAQTIHLNALADFSESVTLADLLAYSQGHQDARPLVHRKVQRSLGARIMVTEDQLDFAQEVTA